eukprot:SAG31_NODE_43176_length_268_cov_0.615385_1_plen_36_part_01
MTYPKLKSTVRPYQNQKVSGCLLLFLFFKKLGMYMY